MAGKTNDFQCATGGGGPQGPGCSGSGSEVKDRRSMSGKPGLSRAARAREAPMRRRRRDIADRLSQDGYGPSHTLSSEDTHTAPVNPQRRPLADRSSGAELSDGRPTARFITWGRCFPETWKSLRTSSRDSARAPARGGQTTTADRNGVRSSADKSPQKGDSHLQTRDTQPKWLEASE